MNELALFAGAGGGILGGKLLGWRTICAVERDAYAAQVLAQRQNDGILESFPIWSDVTTFDGRPWRGLVDVISGGFPCQDISTMGKGKGISGDRSGLWKEFARIIGEVRPQYVFVENSPVLTIKGLGVVLADLSTLGYDSEWQVISASSCGANHERERIWIVANAKMFKRIHKPINRKAEKGLFNNSNPWEAGPWDAAESRVRGMDDGLAFGVDRFKATGNGQVSAVAATAFELLRARFE
jgi:DNA (cytosine-5)-methyltransferase 1